MPSYRGIGKRELIASIRLATAFLKKLDMGPFTDRGLDRLLGKKTIDELEAAPTDMPLMFAIKDTDLRATLTRFLKVIRFHALTDPSIGGKDSEALSVYKKLMSWSAFFPDQENQKPSPIDEEIDSHLLSAMTALLPEDEEPASPAQKRLDAFIQGVRDEEILENQRRKLKAEAGESAESADDNRTREVAEWLEDIIPLVLALSRMGDSEEEIRNILSVKNQGAALMLRALEVMLDIDRREKDLNIKSPISRYKVFLDMPAGSADEIRDAIVSAGDEIIDLMTPFFYSDEWESKINVIVEDDGSGISIAIYTSGAGAQYLADRLSSNLKVLDSGGRLIARRPPPPSSSPSAPAPGF